MSNLLEVSTISQDVNAYYAEQMRYPGLDQKLVFDLTTNVRHENGSVYYHIPPVSPHIPGFEIDSGAVSPAEVIVALSSAGIFTVVYQAIASYLARNRDRELTLTKGKVSITIKGHSLPEENELLKRLAPELLPQVDHHKEGEAKE